MFFSNSARRCSLSFSPQENAVQAHTTIKLMDLDLFLYDAKITINNQVPPKKN